MNKIGIDLGGTKIEGILLDEQNTIINRKRVNTDKEKGYDFILNSISSLIQDLSSMTQNESKIGIGVNGTFVKKTGLITHTSTDCLIGKNLKNDLEKKLEQKILIENDANCFAMAEAILGSGKDYNSVFGVIMGTGVGAGIVIDKKLYTGKSGLAGEWGHHSIDSDGKPCYCGNVGCVDTFISGPSLENRWYELTNEHATLKSIITNSSNIHFKQWKLEFLEKFSIGLSNVINIIDPDIVVIGGGLSNIQFLYDEGKKAVHKKIVGHNTDTQIVPNQLGDSSGVIGAALLN